jgi:SSS family solute:Na+ symporter
MQPSPSHDGLTRYDVAAVALYLVATLAIALACTRRGAGKEEFFLGSRRMPWFAVGLSIMATLMSTISYLAVPGEMIQHGVGFFLGYIHIPFSMAVVFFCWIPFFMRLRMGSAYEYLEQRFSYTVRLLGSVLFVLLRLGWVAVVIYTSSLALSTMLGGHGGGEAASSGLTGLYGCILLMGLFTTFYTSLGGIRAVIWTDVMQSAVMFVGMAITVGYVLVSTGTGPSDWWQRAAQARAAHTSPPLFSFDMTVRVTVITVAVQQFFWTICTHGSDQVVVQRYFATRSLAAARRSYLISAAADVSVGVLLALAGLALLAFYLDYPAYLPEGYQVVDTAQGGAVYPADKVFPYFISHQLGWGLGGVILSALFAAAMSSVSSGVNSVAAVTTNDILSRLLPQWGERMAGGWFARGLSLGVGVLVTLLALGVAEIADDPRRNIIDLMNKGFNLFLGPLAGLFFAGMFLPRCRTRSVVLGTLCGMAVSVVWSYWAEIGMLLARASSAGGAWWFGLLGHEPDGRPKIPTITMAISLPCVTSFLVSALAGWLWEPRQPHPGTQWTWLAVMRSPKREDL